MRREAGVVAADEGEQHASDLTIPHLRQLQLVLEAFALCLFRVEFFPEFAFVLPQQGVSLAVHSGYSIPVQNQNCNATTKTRLHLAPSKIHVA